MARTAHSTQDDDITWADAIELLRSARELIMGEGGLCKNAFARDSSGKSACFNHDRPVAFCIYGAVRQASLRPARSRLYALSLLCDALDPKWERDIASFNDALSTTQQDATEVFDRAITLAKTHMQREEDMQNLVFRPLDGADKTS